MLNQYVGCVVLDMFSATIGTVTVVIIKFVRMRHTFLSALLMLTYEYSTMTFYLLRSQHKV